ncbi:MAG: hypothetical protein VXW32_06620 [Myxococcota bacterium]|nr:hypothetical protein [Myxococcota bacterium]
MRKALTQLVVLATALLFGLSSAPSHAETPRTGETGAHGELLAQNGPRNRPRGKRPNPNRAVQGDRVRVQVMLVHATSGEPYMDPALQRWGRHLRHLRYDSYRLLERRRAALLPQGSRSFEILGDREVSVSLLRKNEQNARLRVQMYRRGQKLVDTTVTVNRNGTFIMAGPAHKDGGILVLPITASY